MGRHWTTMIMSTKFTTRNDIAGEGKLKAVTVESTDSDGGHRAFSVAAARNHDGGSPG